MHGELQPWPTKERLATVLREAGFDVYVGRYSVRIEGIRSSISFEHYGGDISAPTLAADAEHVEDLCHDAARLSAALSAARQAHLFEVYDGNDQLAACFPVHK